MITELAAGDGRHLLNLIENIAQLALPHAGRGR